MAITVHVTGLTCNNCVKHVDEELQEIDSIISTKTTLVKGGQSIIRIEGDAQDQQIYDAIAEAGDYTITSISHS
ncbi:MAG: heavy-metal-associated domain-containing protein [Actinomycetaceae bacterium]|nr:heavy-metal-associated domain-containing protein [Actinomycetaceae bacterium]